MTLAEKCEGRIINLRVLIRLKPRLPSGPLGETDAAMDIGKGLIEESMRALQIAAEGEGFEVMMTVDQVVY